MQSELVRSGRKLAHEIANSANFKTKVKYFTCNRGKDHESEVLNYVCVKKDCDKHGLLCSMCKTDHPNHTTVPLKILLAKLQMHREKPLESSEGFVNELSELEAIHKVMLYDLRTCVESLAQKFREIEVQINDQFSKAKIELLERVQVNMKFNSFIDDAINNRCENREQFIEDIARISSMIEIKEEGRDFKEKEADIQFSANLESVVITLKTLQSEVSQKLKTIEKFVCSDQPFPKYQDIKNSLDKKQKQKSKSKDKKQSTQAPLLHTFNPAFRSMTIVLEEGNKVAKQTKSGEGRFVFTNNQVLSVGQKIWFRIRVLKNWVGLGVAIRERIKFLNYRFEYNNLGHGSYLISCNGYSWSHTETANNIAVVGFKYKEGDIIQVEYGNLKLIYTNITNDNEKYELKTAFNEVEEKDIYFCANLCSDGDCVEVLEATN